MAVGRMLGHAEKLLPRIFARSLASDVLPRATKYNLARLEGQAYSQRLRPEASHHVGRYFVSKPECAALIGLLWRGLEDASPAWQLCLTITNLLPSM